MSSGMSINHLRTINLDHDCLKGCVLSGTQINSTVTIFVLLAFILAIYLTPEAIGPSAFDLAKR